ncbi:MAG: ABC transporter ATP-binding protein [Patescibacteria group bacterium]
MSLGIQQFFSFIHLDLRVRTLLVLICTLFVIKAVIIFIFDYIQARITSNYEREAKSKLYEDAMAASWPFLLKQKIGHLENYMTQEMKWAVRILQMIPDLILDVTSFLIYFIIALRIAPYVTVLAIIIGGVLFLLMRPLVVRVKNYSKEERLLLKEVSHQVNENFTGLKTIKSLQAEEPLVDEGRKIFKQIEFLRLRMHVSKHLTLDLVQPISVIFVSVVFAVSYFQKGFNLAVFVATVYLIQRIFVYIDKAQRTTNQFYSGMPNLLALIDFSDNVRRARELPGGDKKFSFTKELALRDVAFSYGKARTTLSGINIRINKGEMIGIIGPSGAGKTTLIDLILRLFSPTSGVIELDGQAISDISLAEWRKNVGYVSQEIFLKNATVFENIRFYDESISKEKVIEGARLANATQFISDLPNGFETMVGERGVYLSAGQRQRIALARILARSPELLILDEATAALDNESEKMIKLAIENLHGKVTVIIIAHRLTTILDADRIIAIDDGKIVETGAPADLLENHSSYLYKVNNIG